MEIKSRRLIVTPGRFSGDAFPPRFAFHCRSPISHSANACSALVFPELLGPMNTTDFPNSMSTSPKRLKFRIWSRVSIFLLLWFLCQSGQHPETAQDGAKWSEVVSIDTRSEPSEIDSRPICCPPFATPLWLHAGPPTTLLVQWCAVPTLLDSQPLCAARIVCAARPLAQCAASRLFIRRLVATRKVLSRQCTSEHYGQLPTPKNAVLECRTPQSVALACDLWSPAPCSSHGIRGHQSQFRLSILRRH